MDRRIFLGGAAAAAFGVAGGGEAAAAPALQISAEAEDLIVRCSGRELLRYRQRRVEPPEGQSPLLAGSGYLHPVHAPCGVVVTNHYSPDHLHQRGVFSAWTKTQVTLGG